MFLNEEKYITIEISAKLFKGFEYKMTFEHFSKISSEEVINEVKTYMKNFFKIYNLYELSDKVEELILHAHDNLYNPDVIILCDCN